VNIPFDFFDDPRSTQAKKQFERTGYRTYSMLSMPLLNDNDQLVAVVQLINKLQIIDHSIPLEDRVDNIGFTEEDQALFAQFAPSMRLILESSQAFYAAAQKQRAADALMKAAMSLGQSLDLETTLKKVMEEAKLLMNADRSTLWLIDRDRHDLWTQIVDHYGLTKELRVPMGVGFAGRVATTGEVLNIPFDLYEHPDAGNSKKFDQDNGYRTCSLLCMPIFNSNKELSGGDEKSRKQYYPDQTLRSTDGGQHSINISINTMSESDEGEGVRGALVVMEDISQEKRLKSTMYRYMTQELAEQLLAGGDAKMGGDRKEVSVLFSDIRSYTTITESLTAEDVVMMLNEYFETMVEAVFNYKGTLDKYIGDAIMAVFGSPLPIPDHAWMAVQTAIDMRHRLHEFNIKRIEKLKPQNQKELDMATIKIGIGINSDTVISGNIGSTRRMEFTAIGDGVNLGSRLEGASKQYGTDAIISESAYKLCGDRIWIRELDHHNKAANIHITRCQHFLLNPPHDEWDGVWRMTEK
jgi:adenylate cyclase